ncbi:tetratricopeptide repeat protein [Neptunicoccus cionae]|uniref:HcpA family protein n=1 Tax=Neptunicoccus cionae TaxID=2035344 RepID=A0A916R2P9_9RHOB|nr:tetratricopeptide repeat protein [Amylibacter cionae]GGA29468.1 HcpA family protein [Amylibacter cionae]
MIPARRSALISPILAAALAFALPLQAQQTGAPSPAQMEAVEDAYAAEDYAAARAGLLELAETGDALAQARLARLLLDGRGGPADPAGAVDWLQKSVQAENAQAMVLLGQLHLYGAGGLTADPKQAVDLLTRAARAGHLSGMVLLGKLYQSGQGVPADPASAARLFQKAADGGDATAAFEFSRHLSRGLGVELNTAKALEYLTIAAKAGHTEGELFLGLALMTGQGVAQDKAAGINWLLRAAEGDNPMAQRLLATSYLQGDGVEQDTAQALHWMTAAATAGEASAQSNLGYFYATGTGTQQDLKQAFHWYEQASDQGLLRATTALANLYETGQGVAQNLTQAADLYLEAAQQGEPRARTRLARLIGTGQVPPPAGSQSRTIIWVAGLLLETDTPPAISPEEETAILSWLQDRADPDGDNHAIAQSRLGLIKVQRGTAAQDTEQLEQGVTLVKTAAARGDAFGQYQLALLYGSGTGLPQDYIAAHAWANLAAARGVAEAGRRRDLFAKLMTPDQIAQAQTQARTYVAEN